MGSVPCDWQYIQLMVFSALLLGTLHGPVLHYYCFLPFTFLLLHSTHSTALHCHFLLLTVLCTFSIYCPAYYSCTLHTVVQIFTQGWGEEEGPIR